MEKSATARSFTHEDKESDSWIRLLERFGVVKPIGDDDDPCRVVAVTPELWSRRHADRTQDQSVSTLRRNFPAGEPESSDVPKHPAEFIEELKRHRNLQQSTTIEVGPFLAPRALEKFTRRLLESRSMIGETAESEPDCPFVSSETWERAARFVLRASLNYWNAHGTVVPSPSLQSDYEGGVDVVWRYRTRAMFLNFPEEPNHIVTYYGRDQSDPGVGSRGEDNSGDAGEWLLAWLIR